MQTQVSCHARASISTTSEDKRQSQITIHLPAHDSVTSIENMMQENIARQVSVQDESFLENFETH